MPGAVKSLYTGRIKDVEPGVTLVLGEVITSTGRRGVRAFLDVGKRRAVTVPAFWRRDPEGGE